MKQTQDASPSSWQHPPLCCRYLVVHLGIARVKMARPNPEDQSSVYWATGVTRERESEVLGLWACELNGTWRWNRAIDEMVIRGVERVRFVTGERPIECDLDRLGATHLPIGGDGEHDLKQLASQLPRHLRSAVRSAVLESQAAQNSLLRLSRRRGGFEVLESALSAVEKSLQQSGRRSRAGLSGAQPPLPRKTSELRS